MFLFLITGIIQKSDLAQEHLLPTSGDTPVLWVITTPGSVCTNAHEHAINLLQLEFPHKAHSRHDTTAVGLLYSDCQCRGSRVGSTVISELWIDPQIVQSNIEHMLFGTTRNHLEYNSLSSCMFPGIMIKSSILSHSQVQRSGTVWVWCRRQTFSAQLTEHLLPRMLIISWPNILQQ